MYEKIKKFFSVLGAVFCGIIAGILGTVIHNDRKRTASVGSEQSADTEQFGNIEDAVSSNVEIFEAIRRRKENDN